MSESVFKIRQSLFIEDPKTSPQTKRPREEPVAHDSFDLNIENLGFTKPRRLNLSLSPTTVGVLRDRSVSFSNRANSEESNPALCQLTEAQRDPETVIPLAPKQKIDCTLQNCLTNATYPHGWSLEANLEAIHKLGKQGNPFRLMYSKEEIAQLIESKKQRKTTLCEVLTLHDLGYDFTYSAYKQEYTGVKSSKQRSQKSLSGYETELPENPPQLPKGSSQTALSERMTAILKNAESYEKFWSNPERVSLLKRIFLEP